MKIPSNEFLLINPYEFKFNLENFGNRLAWIVYKTEEKNMNVDIAHGS